MEIRDALTLDGKPRRTSDGYLVASVRAARTGIQEYAGVELGRPTMDRVRVWRPEAEVFSRDAMASFTSLPLTIEHPANAVTADTWRDVAVGNTGEDIARDGEYIRVPIIVKDAKAIREIESGRRELSMGYHTDLKWESGTTPDGMAYDAIQTNLRGNHLAIVKAARGGPELKIGDSKMTRTIVVDGLTVEVSDKDAAIIERTMKRDADKVKALEDEISALKEKLDEAKKGTETKDAQIATLTTQLADAQSPARIADAARMMADTISKARALVPAVVTDGRSVDDIRKQVVDAKLGDAAKGWTADQIAASFGTLTANVKASDAMADAFRAGPAVVTDARVDAWKKANQSMADGYKFRPGAAN